MTERKAGFDCSEVCIPNEVCTICHFDGPSQHSALLDTGIAWRKGTPVKWKEAKSNVVVPIETCEDDIAGVVECDRDLTDPAAVQEKSAIRYGAQFDIDMMLFSFAITEEEKDFLVSTHRMFGRREGHAELGEKYTQHLS